jgi:hypothetical protein
MAESSRAGVTVAPRQLNSHTVEPWELAAEEAIVWVDAHPENHRYIREDVLLVPSRQRRPSEHSAPGRMVAYAVLRPDARASSPGRFHRRVWWLASHDPYPGGRGAPCEGVDPLTVRAGAYSCYPVDEV